MGEISPFMVPIAICTVIGATIVLTPLARAWARRLEGGGRAADANRELTARLERIEQAIDAMATEVERIGEGQRFTTKLLSERGREVPAVVPSLQPTLLPSDVREPR